MSSFKCLNSVAWHATCIVLRLVSSRFWFRCSASMASFSRLSRLSACLNMSLSLVRFSTRTYRHRRKWTSRSSNHRKEGIKESRAVCFLVMDGSNKILHAGFWQGEGNIISLGGGISLKYVYTPNRFLYSSHFLGGQGKGSGVANNMGQCWLATLLRHGHTW